VAADAESAAEESNTVAAPDVAGSVDGAFTPINQAVENLTVCTICLRRYNTDGRKAILCPCGWMCCKSCMEAKGPDGKSLSDGGDKRIGATYDVIKCPGCRQRHPSVAKNGYKLMEKLLDLMNPIKQAFSVCAGVEGIVSTVQRDRDRISGLVDGANTARDRAIQAKEQAEADFADAILVRNEAIWERDECNAHSIGCEGSRDVALRAKAEAETTATDACAARDAALRRKMEAESQAENYAAERDRARRDLAASQELVKTLQSQAAAYSNDQSMEQAQRIAMQEIVEKLTREKERTEQTCADAIRSRDAALAEAAELKIKVENLEVEQKSAKRLRVAAEADNAAEKSAKELARNRSADAAAACRKAVQSRETAMRQNAQKDSEILALTSERDQMKREKINADLTRADAIRSRNEALEAKAVAEKIASQSRSQALRMKEEAEAKIAVYREACERAKVEAEAFAHQAETRAKHAMEDVNILQHSALRAKKFTEECAGDIARQRDAALEARAKSEQMLKQTLLDKESQTRLRVKAEAEKADAVLQRELATKKEAEAERMKEESDSQRNEAYKWRTLAEADRDTAFNERDASFRIRDSAMSAEEAVRAEMLAALASQRAAEQETVLMVEARDRVLDDKAEVERLIADHIQKRDDALSGRAAAESVAAEAILLRDTSLRAKVAAEKAAREAAEERDSAVRRAAKAEDTVRQELAQLVVKNYMKDIAVAKRVVQDRCVMEGYGAPYPTTGIADGAAGVMLANDAAKKVKQAQVAVRMLRETRHAQQNLKVRVQQHGATPREDGLRVRHISQAHAPREAADTTEGVDIGSGYAERGAGILAQVLTGDDWLGPL